MSSHPYRQRLPRSADLASTSSSASESFHTTLPEAPYRHQPSPQAPPTASHPNTGFVYPASLAPAPVQNALAPEAYKFSFDDFTDWDYDDHRMPLGSATQFNSQPLVNPAASSNKPSAAGQKNMSSPSFHSQVASPNSYSLSATSSTTNSNPYENHNASSSGLYLPTHKNANHNRSVSSSSSFQLDKSETDAIDFDQNVLTQYLGDNANHLMPRIQTIELYRKNAKKSNDPTVLFQYAQYMLQTALILEQNAPGSADHSFEESSPKKGSTENLASTFKKAHSKSSQSLDFSQITSEAPVDEKEFKRSLLKEAQHYLRKLSDKGYADAQYLLADALSSGAFGKVENREAFTLFQSAAKRGHIESAYRTSYCYEEGLGTGRDARKAVDYLKMAASKNHPSAMYKLGVYSFYGRMGLPHDDNTKKMGMKWLRRASDVATELIAAAPYELGKIYFTGFKDILLQDQKYALELYSQAAALGHIESAAILGHCYEVGEIVPQDSNLSIHYYTQAALSGDANSMLAMCAWYLVGNEPYLPKDENEAYEWAKRAAMCNLPKAQFALATFFEKGIGCAKNSATAQYWYARAAENGDERALSKLEDKELVAKIAKTLKKRKSKGILKNSNIANLPQQTSKNEKIQAQEKDCIIM